MLIEMERRKNHPDFSEIQWVAKAADKDRDYIRPFTNRLLFHEGWCVATDGARLHAHILNDLGKFPEGIYRILTMRKTYFMLYRETPIPYGKDVVPQDKFPDWQHVFMTMVGRKFEKHEVLLLNGDYLHGALARVIRALPKESAVNYQLVKDLMGTTYTAVVYGPTDPICFYNSNRLAAVMPMDISRLPAYWGGYDERS